MTTVWLPVVTNTYKAPSTMSGVGSTYAAHLGYERQAALRKVGAGWWYNWTYKPGTNGTPMIWGPSYLGKPLDGMTDWLMFYNEPEFTSQGYCPVEQAAVDWARLPTLYPGRRYVSPGCFDLGWLERWLPLIDRLPDALAVHSYVNRDNPGAMKEQFARAIQIADSYGIGEVWVTEWSYVGEAGESLDTAAEFICDMLAWFETQNKITRQAYFQLSHAGDGSEPWWGVNWDTSLVDFDTGEITALGIAYSGKEYADPRADVSGPNGEPDGTVDIFDLTRVASNFGLDVEGT